jgi:CheY-like chemotaxis protein/DNA-directed RNA polymerase specialized sigma24 family protein
MSSLSAEIARHVPYLRRYARALTGSQVDGDRYVRATLEAIVAAPGRLDPSLGARVSLFRTFQAVISGERPGAPFGPDRGGALVDRLGALALDARQALLLTVMENFTVREAGLVLARTPDHIEMLIGEAVNELVAQPPTTALIIEDEAVISLDLAGIVRDMGHTVVGVATTSSEAVRAARAMRPGFILADIQLADGSSGIDAVQEILAVFTVPVIFITAYPERLLTGERPEPTFLVTKPFVPDSIRHTIGHALLLAAETATKAA